MGREFQSLAVQRKKLLTQTTLCYLGTVTEGTLLKEHPVVYRDTMRQSLEFRALKQLHAKGKGSKSDPICVYT